MSDESKMKTVLFAGLDGGVFIEVIPVSVLNSRLDDDYYGDKTEITILNGQSELIEFMKNNGIDSLFNLSEQDYFLVILD